MPYAPGITYNTGVIGQGIANLGQNLRGALEQYRREKQEGQFLDQQFEGLAKAVAVSNPDRASELAKFPGLSLAQKRGKLAGLAFEVDQMRQQQAQSLRERQVAASEGQLTLARDQAAAAAAARARDQETSRAFAGELASLAQGGPMADGYREPGSVSLGDVVQAAGKTGFNLPAGTLMDAIRAGTRREAQAPREFTIGGRAGTYSPETGAFQVFPSEEMTPAQRASAVAQLRTEYARTVAKMADPDAATQRSNLEAVLDMLDEQFNEFGIKPPKRTRAAAADDPAKADAGKGNTRMTFDKSGSLLTK